MLRQSACDLQPFVIGDLRLDGSIVLFGDGSSYREPDSETTVFFFGAGFVCAIETVEQVRQRILAQRFFHRVFGFDNDIFTRMTKRYLDVVVLGSILDGVLTQDADESFDRSFIAAPSSSTVGSGGTGLYIVVIGAIVRLIMIAAAK